MIHPSVPAEVESAGGLVDAGLPVVEGAVENWREVALEAERLVDMD